MKLKWDIFMAHRVDFMQFNYSGEQGVKNKLMPDLKIYERVQTFQSIVSMDF